MLKAVVDNLDGISEALKGEYKPGTGDFAGKFVLNVESISGKSPSGKEFVFALEDVGGLKATVASTRGERDEAVKALAPFEGMDVAKAKEAIKKVEEWAKADPEGKAKEQYEALKAQLTEKHQGELGEKDEALKTVNSQLEKVMIDAAAIKALAENKGATDLLLPHVRSKTRMKQTDTGEYVVEVIGNDGNTRISPASGSTAPMTISELVAEMKNSESFARAFDGSGASGSGATGGGRLSSGGSVDLSKMSPSERLAYADANNITK